MFELYVLCSDLIHNPDTWALGGCFSEANVNVRQVRAPKKTNLRMKWCTEPHLSYY